MTIEQMRELDAWTAENAMGWKIVAHPRVGELECVRYNNGDTCLAYRLSGGRSALRMWRPTINPADAMEVLKKCLGRADLLVMHDGQKFSISERVPDWEFNTLSEGPTLQLAICLCAKEIFTKNQKETK